MDPEDAVARTIKPDSFSIMYVLSSGGVTILFDAPKDFNQSNLKTFLGEFDDMCKKQEKRTEDRADKVIEFSKAISGDEESEYSEIGSQGTSGADVA